MTKWSLCVLCYYELLDWVWSLCIAVHGYCTHPNDCTCEEGYTGTLCNIDADPCGHLTPCVHGECSNVGNEIYSCSCDVGYTGVNCDINIDECSSGPCQNGATCEVSRVCIRKIMWIFLTIKLKGIHK